MKVGVCALFDRPRSCSFVAHISWLGALFGFAAMWLTPGHTTANQVLQVFIVNRLKRRLNYMVAKFKMAKEGR